MLVDGLDRAGDLRGRLEGWCADELAPSGVRVVCSCRESGDSPWRMPHLSRKEYDGKVKRGELAAYDDGGAQRCHARGWVVYDLAPPTEARRRGGRRGGDWGGVSYGRARRARAR